VAKCQRTRVRGKGAIMCRNDAMPGSRYCRRHTGSAVAARSQRRRSRAAARNSRGGGGDSCGLFVVGFLTVVLAAVVAALV
jgi:hypothetical protein